jgi:ABC-2 type transport system permease protein
MTSPLLYLTLVSLRNRLRVRLRRVREPRYLIGSIVGLGYWLLIVGRPFAGQRRGAVGRFDAIGRSEMAIVVIAVLLLAITAVMWLWPGRRQPALAFTRAEVQLLFTAPIARRRLVRYRVLRSQLAVLFGSAILTLFMGPASLLQGARTWAGVALVMVIVNLHVMGISLAAASGRSRRAHIVRNWLPRAVLAAAVMAVGIDVAVRGPAATGGAAGGSFLSDVVGVLSTGISGVVLWPFAMLARLPLAASAGAFAIALPWTLIVVALNYIWVERSDAPFEEASAELAEKVARVRAQGVRPVGRRTVATAPFRLGSTGPVEIALLWKNLISMGRFSWVMLLRAIPFVLAAVGVLSKGRGGTRMDGLAFLSLIAAVFIIWIGPQIARADLRQDLPNLAVLRTWPLRGATLVRGEVLAPGLVLVVLAWITLAIGALLSMSGSPRVLIPNLPASLVAAMALAPGLVFVQLLVQNAIAVAFPSWVTVGRQRAGVEVMGQRMLMTFGSMLALIVAALPAALLAALVFIAIRALTGGVPIVLAGLVAAVALLGEAFVGAELLGLLLERTDVSALDPPDA